MISPIGKSNFKERKAFTLIELLLVIVVISILAGISVPKFRKTFRDIQLASSTHTLVSLMRYAQERSIIEGVSFKIQFDRSTNTYLLLKETEPFSNKFEREKGRYRKMNRIPLDILFKASEKEIVFFPDGRATSVEITLENKNKNRKRITAKGIGGRIRIYD